jgi:hypothetical protein
MDCECVSLLLRCVYAVMWVLQFSCLLVIDQEFVTWIMLALFMHLFHLWNSLDNNPILMLAHAFIPFVSRT